MKTSASPLMHDFSFSSPDVPAEIKQPPLSELKLSFNYPIPREVRRFGRALDPAMLEPGDLILTHDKKKRWPARKVVEHQSRMFPDEHAKWSHAAVSGGRFLIVEATLLGVRGYEYWNYMTDDYEVKVRRLKGADRNARSLIAFHAALRVKAAYGFLNLISLKNSLRSGNFWPTGPKISNGVICSQLYFESCMREGFLLANCPPEQVSPAHLSQTQQLEDVELRWVAV